ncbi:Uncharacterized protein PECH_008330 [Penicillium ucsense]|uniref:Transcription factor TFIIIC complex subunit Tfc6 n=1 Tax=Penicillium ucsense TaxID=2839758 RepID=A0A8J8VZF1_9EURO|nr:Uncharacterized protein PECM_008161 [Penicillium ucsense]KAF7734229.1 Uncharacterized protein PECH_008330 [Penicillium ucsense]
MSSARRSGRLKGPRTTYTIDAFESAGISDESGSEEQQQSSKKRSQSQLDEVSASDDDFKAEEMDDNDDHDEDNEDDEEEEEEEVYTEEDSPQKLSAKASRKSSGLKRRDVDDSIAVSTTPRNSSENPQYSSPRSQQKVLESSGVNPKNKSLAAETRSRGCNDIKENESKPMHYISTFGDDTRDLLAAVYARDRWARGIDTCLPTRYTLDHQSSLNDYEFGPTWGADPQDVEQERTAGWDWYYDAAVGRRFHQAQESNIKLKEADARRKYLPQAKKRKQTILLGPASDQKSFSLGYHESLNFGRAWADLKAQKSDRVNANVREGWLINFEHKVQCLAWAPGQDGLSQYLAVVTPIGPAQKGSHSSKDEGEFSSFREMPSYPCALQLWEFKGEPAGPITRTLDMQTSPRLRLLLCTEWGDLRRITWCPMNRAKQASDDNAGTKNIGLLAGIWGDGKLRVLDVKLSSGEATEFVAVRKPAFEAKIPSSVSTCMTWLSPTDIAVGCSDGFVAIWSILPTDDLEAVPYFHKPVHTSYVLSITSAYPTNPHLLVTTSIDGETRLWSMVDPESDNAAPVRQRQAPGQISYSPILQAVCTYDENDFGRYMPLRRFFATHSAGRMPSSVTSMAPCSFFHPSLLFGTASGEVVAANPLRRLLYSKEQHWQQTWFSHDWSPGTDKNSAGASRFFDGFRAETQSLARNLSGDKRPQIGSYLTTIHDEQTHVTALAWNPNRATAGWACAGMGCGIVRVEDLAI